MDQGNWRVLQQKAEAWTAAPVVAGSEQQGGIRFGGEGHDGVFRGEFLHPPSRICGI